MTRVIDGKGLILGRLCTVVAKGALLGESFEIVNIGEVIIVGNKKFTFGKYKNMREKGRPIQGPFIKRSAKDLFKRSLRNMLPYKKPRGREALERIKAYKGLPERYKGKELETIEGANVSKISTTKFVKLQDVTKFLGGK